MPETVASLLEQGKDLPDHEAVRLLLCAADAERSWMLGNPPVGGDVAARFLRFVDRRRSGEPIQYIEESTQFGPIELQVDGRALIPRPETERLWELCLGILDGLGTPVVVDICTGSGNLALALQHSLPRATIVGTDISGDAIALARTNSTALGLDVSFTVGDLFDGVPQQLRGKIDLIVSNPPYVAEAEYRLLPPEITRYEPATALVAGADGLDVLRRIAAAAGDWLRPGGAVACEIGETQGNACLGLFGSYRPRIEKDLTGRDRFVLGWTPMARDVH